MYVNFTHAVQDKLKKEEQAASLNRAKLQNQWRVLMRQGMPLYVFSAAVARVSLVCKANFFLVCGWQHTHRQKLVWLRKTRCSNYVVLQNYGTA